MGGRVALLRRRAVVCIHFCSRIIHSFGITEERKHANIQFSNQDSEAEEAPYPDPEAEKTSNPDPEAERRPRTQHGG